MSKGTLKLASAQGEELRSLVDEFDEIQKIAYSVYGRARKANRRFKALTEAIDLPASSTKGGPVKVPKSASKGKAKDEPEEEESDEATGPLDASGEAREDVEVEGIAVVPVDEKKAPEEKEAETAAGAKRARSSSKIFSTAHKHNIGEIFLVDLHYPNDNPHFKTEKYGRLGFVMLRERVGTVAAPMYVGGHHSPGPRRTRELTV